MRPPVSSPAPSGPGRRYQPVARSALLSKTTCTEASAKGLLPCLSLPVKRCRPRSALPAVDCRRTGNSGSSTIDHCPAVMEVPGLEPPHRLSRRIIHHHIERHPAFPDRARRRWFGRSGTNSQYRIRSPRCLVVARTLCVNHRPHARATQEKQQTTCKPKTHRTPPFTCPGKTILTPPPPLFSEPRTHQYCFGKPLPR